MQGDLGGNGTIEHDARHDLMLCGTLRRIMPEHGAAGLARVVHRYPQIALALGAQVAREGPTRCYARALAFRTTARSRPRGVDVMEEPGHGGIKFVSDQDAGVLRQGPARNHRAQP